MMNRASDTLTYEFPEMQPRTRLRELILHIAKASVFDDKFDKAKLIGILFYADFTSFRLFGKPITGAKYWKLPDSPVPVGLDPLLEEMVGAGDLGVDLPGYSHLPMRVVAQREPNYALFAAQDIAYVDEVIRNLWDLSGTDVTDLTHGVMFKVLEVLEAIPYEASIISDEEITEENIIGARELMKKYGWERLRPTRTS
jgi:hypothetical protein